MAYIGYDGRAADIKKLDSIAPLFDSVTTNFAITVNGSSFAPANAAGLLISVGGVIQEPFVDYNVSGANLVFTTPQTTGASFFGVALGASIAIGTVGDNTITNAKIGETISIAKGGTGAITADAALTNLGGGAAGKAVFSSATQATARTQLGLGNSATKNTGVAAGEVVELVTGGKLPAVDGSLLTGIASGNIIGVQAFYSSGTYTPTAGTKKVLLEGRGGGGNGGSGSGGGPSMGGGGGGGGAASSLLRMIVACTTSQTVTIGGSAAATTFGALATFPAGANGTSGSIGTGGAGGISTGFDTLRPGGLSGGSGNGTSGYAGGIGGGGGGFGGGGGGNNNGSATPGGGGGATVRGAGGGGGEGGQATLSGAAGGAGAQGYLIVYEFA